MLYYTILYYTKLYYNILLHTTISDENCETCTLFHLIPVDCKFVCSCLKSGGKVNYCQASQVFFVGFFDKSKVNLSTGKFF